MADVTLTYKGSDILELSDSGSATLKTGGKYCEDDIAVEYVKPSGGGDPYEMLVAVNNNTATNLSLGDTVTAVRPYMFKGNARLTNFDFSYITSIGESSFFGAGLSGDIVVPKNITMASVAFRACPMRTITFKGGVNRFDQSCFEGCSSLQIIDAKMTSSITGSFTSFYNTQNLQALILRQSYVYPSNGGFPSSCGLRSSGYIYVPQAIVSNYKNATNWSVYADRILPIEGSYYETHYADGTVIS